MEALPEVEAAGAVGWGRMNIASRARQLWTDVGFLVARVLAVLAYLKA